MFIIDVLVGVFATSILLSLCYATFVAAYELDKRVFKGSLELYGQVEHYDTAEKIGLGFVLVAAIVLVLIIFALIGSVFRG